VVETGGQLGHQIRKAVKNPDALDFDEVPGQKINFNHKAPPLIKFLGGTLVPGGMGRETAASAGGLSAYSSTKKPASPGIR